MGRAIITSSEQNERRIKVLARALEHYVFGPTHGTEKRVEADCRITTIREAD